MINEESNLKPKRKSKQQIKHLVIDLGLNSSSTMMGRKEFSMSQNEALLRNAQKKMYEQIAQKYEASIEIKKLIRNYSKTGVDTHLTTQQFVQLINDLMSTIDFPKLNKDQIKSVFNSIDADFDDNISAAELEQIIKQNKIK